MPSEVGPLLEEDEDETSSTGDNDVDRDLDDPSAPYDEQNLLTVSKAYCNYCYNYNRKMMECVDCGAYICVRESQHETGCIIFRSSPIPYGDFLCVICEHDNWGRLPNPPRGGAGCPPYDFGGYNIDKRAKLTWPLVFVSMTLSPIEKHLERSIFFDIESHYMHAPSNFCHVDIVMGNDTPSSSIKKMDTSLNFIEASLRGNVPANTFVLINARHHSELLQYGGATGDPVSPTQMVLEEFCGKKLLDKMQQAAMMARRFPAPDPSKWYNDSPQTRGGWRCLLLSTFPSAMQAPGSFDNIKRLVVDDVFDCVVAFVGTTRVLQTRVAPNHIIENIGIDKTGGIWDAVSEAICHDRTLLSTNRVVVICRERDGADPAKVLARQIAKHQPSSPQHRPEFQTCGNPHCPGGPRRPQDFFWQDRDQGLAVKVTCNSCHWDSGWVRDEDLKEYFFKIEDSPSDVFWHPYPATPNLQLLFACSMQLRVLRQLQEE